MNLLISFLALTLSFSLVAQEGTEQVVLFDRTSGAKAEPVTTTGAAPKQVDTKAVKKIEKRAPAPAVKAVKKEQNLQTAVRKEIQAEVNSDLVVTGKSKLNKSGEAVVVVPVAKPGHISGVTPTGEIVMIPLTQPKTEVVSASLVASTEPVATTSTSTSISTMNATTTSTADENIEAEVAEAEALSVTAVNAPKEGFFKNMDLYVSGVVGFMSYPSVATVDTASAFTGAIGYKLSSNKKMMFELGLGTARYKMDVRNLTFFNHDDVFDVTQYQTHVGAMYEFDPILSTKLIPSVGGVLSYTYRYYNLTNGVSPGDKGESTATDGGVSAALDYAFNETYSVGMDFKFLLNLSHNINASYINPNLGYRNVPVIETNSRYTAGISAKMNF